MDDTTEREALANLIPLGFDKAHDGVEHVHDAADRILASDWLARHDAEVAARTWEEGAWWALKDQGEIVTVYVREAIKKQSPYRADARIENGADA